MIDAGSRRKFYIELLSGIALLMLASFQTVYGLPSSSHFWLKVVGIVIEAAIGVSQIISAMLLARRGSASLN